MLPVRRELQVRRAQEANGSSLSPRRITSLDREGPYDVELQPSGGDSSSYGAAQQQREYARANDRARLMAGLPNSSSAYDPGED